MIFELTDELKQKIIQNLENQNEKFVLDAKNSNLISVTDSSFNERLLNEQFFYLPEWNSKNGFELMQNFVNALHSPLAKDSLQNILYSGRGVFKSFKTELKNYPQIEKVWHSYKNRKMSAFVQVWYDELCEIWGLEKLEIESENFEDESLDLLKDDFSFREYDFSKDKSKIIQLFRESCLGLNGEFSQSVTESVFNFWQNQFLQNECQKGYICNTLQNGVAGAFTFLSQENQTEKCANITSFFVLKEFQGLGIGKMLLEMGFRLLKKQGFKWILLMYTAIPKSLETLLIKYNFLRTDFGFIAELQNQ